MPPDAVQYASAAALHASCARAFLPPLRVTVSAHAAQHRELRNEGGGYVGRWDNTAVPYLVGPMDALTSPDYLTVALVGPGQSAKTSTAENWLLHDVQSDPADWLWFMQTERAMQDYVKTRINPMIQCHRALSDRIGSKPIDNSISFKNFGAMRVQLLAATATNLISKSAPRIVVDEEDAYDPSLGDIGVLVDVRRQTFGRESKVLRISHPDRAGGLDPARDWNAGIMRAYQRSTRRVWYWACPECGMWSSPNPTASRVMVLDYPEEAPLDELAAQTRLLCPVNGCLLTDSARRGMNAGGKWVARGQEIAEDGEISGTPIASDIDGYWIVGVMSPFLLGGIGGLVRARVEAERAYRITGDDTALRQVLPKMWGIPYAAPRTLGKLDAAALADRAEPMLALGTVPQGVRFLTAFADVQQNRFELLVRGWGVRGESWIVDYRTIAADPATSPADWNDLFAVLLDGAWKLADGSGRVMRLQGAGVDHAGGPGVSQQAHDAWIRWRRQRKIVLRGRMDGRDAWTLVPTKGMGQKDAPLLQVVYPDSQRKDRLVRTSGQVPLAQFNANVFKDHLAGQLARGEPGPWFVHFPYDLRSSEPPHRFFEGLVAEERLPGGAWRHSSSTVRNEPTDLMVGSYAVAHLHGVARLNWERPPAWAGEWDVNPRVGESGVGRQDAGVGRQESGVRGQGSGVSSKQAPLLPPVEGVRVALPHGGETVLPHPGARAALPPRSGVSARLA